MRDRRKLDRRKLDRRKFISILHYICENLTHSSPVELVKANAKLSLDNVLVSRSCQWSWPVGFTSRSKPVGLTNKSQQYILLISPGQQVLLSGLGQEELLAGLGQYVLLAGPGQQVLLTGYFKASVEINKSKDHVILNLKKKSVYNVSSQKNK